MPNAYIVNAVRSAGGKKNGRLAKWHPISLGAAVLDGLVEKTGIDASLIDDVIVGCVAQSGAQAGNIGRNIVLASQRVPESVPGTSVDRQCGSSQQAIHFAAQAVMSGTQDIVVAAGVEHMTSVPIGSNVVDSFKAGHGMPFSEEMNDKYGAALEARGQRMFSQFEGAEILAENYNLTRTQMDSFAVESHTRAIQAIKEGRFKGEIIPLKGTDKQGNEVLHDTDEGVRPGSTVESLSKLKSLKELGSKGKEKGLLTAAVASQICDGAAAVLICNEDGLKKLGLAPMAKIVSMALAGTDPVTMLAGPIPATVTALKKANLSLDEIDVYEVNEAFASVPLAWATALKADMKKLNPNGGAIALGHPLGGSGAKLMTTLVHELNRSGGRYGLQAMCEGGGTANVTIIERVGTTQAKL